MGGGTSGLAWIVERLPVPKYCSDHRFLGGVMTSGSETLSYFR